MDTHENNTQAIDPFHPSLEIGWVLEAGSTSAKVALDEGPEADVNSISQQTNVGEFVLLRSGKNGVLGKVKDMFVEDGQNIALINNGKHQQLVARVDLLISINFETGEIYDGIAHRPKIHEKAYQAHTKLIQIVLEHQLDTAAGNKQVTISYAKLGNADETPVTLTPEKLFGKHCGIIGMSGSGKSWSVARLVEECARYKSKVILLDATGEYYTMERRVRHLHLGKGGSKDNISKEVALPYFHLTEQDLFVMFSPQGEYQAPKLKEAIKSLKLARLEPSIAPDGTILKVHKDKLEYERLYAKHIDEIDSPYATFVLENLSRQIRNECVDPQRSAQEPGVWGGPNAAAYSACIPMISRIDDMVRASILASVFQPEGKPSLLNEINAFLKDKEHSILRVSLQNLAFVYSVREVVANAIGRYLLSLARKDVYRKAPLLLIVDEAHQFLNKQFVHHGSHYSLDSFGLIAKEGRKYGINICLATQRPRDIPEEVLSQMGTLIVHRLTNDLDRGIIERASADVDHASMKTIPGLTPGRCIIMGIDFPMPLDVRVIPPTYKPNSAGPDFQKNWG